MHNLPEPIPCVLFIETACCAEQLLPVLPPLPPLLAPLLELLLLQRSCQARRGLGRYLRSPRYPVEMPGAGCSAESCGAGADAVGGVAG